MYAAKKDPDHPWLTYYEGMPVPDGRFDQLIRAAAVAVRLYSPCALVTAP